MTLDEREVDPAILAAQNMAALMENDLEMNIGRPRMSRYEPKRRAFLLAAFLACLTTVTFGIQTGISFLKSILENNEVWKSLKIYLERTDHMHNNCSWKET